MLCFLKPKYIHLVIVKYFESMLYEKLFGSFFCFFCSVKFIDGYLSPSPSSRGLGWKLWSGGSQCVGGSIWGKDSQQLRASLLLAGAGSPGALIPWRPCGP